MRLTQKDAVGKETEIGETGGRGLTRARRAEEDENL